VLDRIFPASLGKGSHAHPLPQRYNNGAGWDAFERRAAISFSVLCKLGGGVPMSMERRHPALGAIVEARRNCFFSTRSRAWVCIYQHRTHGPPYFRTAAHFGAWANYHLRSPVEINERDDGIVSPLA
jgi:hypothetical protein